MSRRALSPTPEMSDTLFVTGVARIVESEVFEAVADWWRFECALRMLDAKDARERDALAMQLEGQRALWLALRNLVAGHEGLIDGRRTRWQGGGAGGGDSKSAARAGTERARAGAKAGGGK